MRKTKAKSSQSVKRFNPINGLRSPLKLLNFILVFAIIGSLFIMFSRAATPAGMYGSIEKDQVGRINYVRGAYGKGPLQHIECLNSVAEAWTLRMAQGVGLIHNPSLTANVDSSCGKSWTLIGENVGRGGNSGVIFDAFMASPAHQANILRNEFLKVGVGAYYDSTGTLWITQVFARCNNCNGKWAANATVPTDPSSTPNPPPPGTPPPPTSSCPRFPSMRATTTLPLLARPSNPPESGTVQTVNTASERRDYYYASGGTRWTANFYNHSISSINPNTPVTAHTHPNADTHQIELDYSAQLRANPSGQYTPVIQYSNIWNYTQSLWVRRYSSSTGALLYAPAESNGGTGVTASLTRAATNYSYGQTTGPTLGPCN